MNASLLKLQFVTAAVWFLALAGLAADSPGDVKFAEFKAKMLPQVGQKITAVGKFDSGKAGWWLPFEGWGLYLESRTTNRADLAKLDALGRFRLHTVKAVGVLRHQKELRPDKPMVQGVPEHFYFDVSEVTVTDLEPVVSPEVPKVK